MVSIMLVLFFFAQPATVADATPGNNEIGAAINSLIAGGQNPLLVKADFSKQANDLALLYQAGGNQLLWLGENRSQSLIDSALAVLANAKADGLNPIDYDADSLKRNFELAMTLPLNAVDELAKFDTALSISLLRFINDLHYGRVQPQSLDYPAPFGNKPGLDSVHLIKQAIEQQSLANLAQQVQPKFRQYQQLKQALASYRQAPQASVSQPLVFQQSLRPGDSHPQLAELRQRLITLGAMAEDTQTSNSENTYSERLQEAVKNFQEQQGLKADGIIGKETAALLNQSLEQKISQIELSMERLRWLPDDISGPLIIVNIPAFQLWAFNALDDPNAITMKVIVGKALQNQTPVLFEEMQYLEFMPYWNIPKSIMDKEILPKLYNDFGYLQNQNIELVQRQTDENEVDSWDGIFDDIRRGKVRARQRPGRKNPLGKVKFIFPNKEDVYLHDTSTHSLFSRSRRDFSHGCVRVEDAEKLAEFVLSKQPESDWDITAIQQAMSGSKTRRVTLKQPIPVLFLYATSYVDQDNQIHFYRDIYQQDAALEKALGISSENNSLATAQTATPAL
ncbi:L,D-transpeptidase family protein [Methylomonas sp. LL1]|nr:L,D-transpeptidase family protein [Methylomonas sp. LL1]